MAAAIHPDVKTERIFGVAGPFSWDSVLEVLRKQNPERKFMDNFSGGDSGIVYKDRPRSEQLLRDLGVEGFISLEETVREASEVMKKQA